MVHGAWHDAWCWSRLVPELETLGHECTTVTLPGEDPAATFETYAGIVAEVVDADTTLVGHSLAGLTIPLVAARTPVKRLVYVCSLVPIPGRTFIEQLSDEPGTLDLGYLAGLEEVDEHTRAWTDLDLARHHMYADCGLDDAEQALERMRPQSTAPYVVPCPLDTLRHAPAIYVLCREDRLVMPEHSRQVARDRLGADLVELDGSHSPFWSRPAELAVTLAGLA